MMNDEQSSRWVRVYNTFARVFNSTAIGAGVLLSVYMLWQGRLEAAVILVAVAIISQYLRVKLNAP